MLPRLRLAAPLPLWINVPTVLLAPIVKVPALSICAVPVVPVNPALALIVPLIACTVPVFVNGLGNHFARQMQACLTGDGEDINLVTEYDKRSEALIVERLSKAFPQDAIVAEEGTSVRGDPGGALRLWYVDPLDGTTNFAHGMPILTHARDRLAALLDSEA